ncbi:transcription elongation regulator 1-like protein isoform X2 [Channa argus]
MTHRIWQAPGGHSRRTRLLLNPSQLSGLAQRDAAKSRANKNEDSSFRPLLHVISVSPLHLPLLTVHSPTAGPGFCSLSGGAYDKWAELHMAVSMGMCPLILTNLACREAWLEPIISLERRLSPLLQVMDIRPSFFSSQMSSRFTLLTHKKRGVVGGKVSYKGALLLKTETTADNKKQCVGVSLQKVDNADEDEELVEEGGSNDKRPVASTPVPGSPWCVVWTGDDRVFFFNPTIHLSVWERPGDLIGRDISCIIDDPPHKRKKKTPVDKDGLRDEDRDDDHKHMSKRSRTEGSDSPVPQPGDIQLLPLELRVTHFREMMLERGVSAFSTWEKELHKMVFDPRYLLLTSDQRKQVFDQFVKSRMKEEYKEKKSKLQKAREEFKLLLEEGKITTSSTFKGFCAHYRNDQRFSVLNSKKEQEVLFNHYISSLKKRDKENRARLRKMR